MLQTTIDSACASPALEPGGGLDVGRQRACAEAVLSSLMRAKTECEHQLVRFNRSDMIKTITGRSSIDKAIASTRRIIENLDRALATTNGSMPEVQTVRARR